jgi:hypothetical protein
VNIDAKTTPIIICTAHVMGDWTEGEALRILKKSIVMTRIDKHIKYYLHIFIIKIILPLSGLKVLSCFFLYTKKPKQTALSFLSYFIVYLFRFTLCFFRMKNNKIYMCFV